MRTRRWLVATVATALAVSLAACTSDESPDPREVAEALADGLVSGDLSGVTLTGRDTAGAQTAREDVFAPLLERLGAAGAPQVTVADVVTEADGDDAGRYATATLAYAWPVTEEASWEYTTTVDLTLREEADEELWTVAWAPDLLVPDLGEGDRLQITQLRPERADILGADDAVIVTERPVYRIGIDKTRLEAGELEGAARELAAAVGIDADAYADRVAAAGERAFVEAITVRTDDTAGVDVDAARGVPGAVVLDGELPLAPTREFARALLGRVGEATAEIVESSDGRIAAGDTVGLSGLQRTYDDLLRGSAGLTIEVVPSAEGSEAVEVFRADAVDGTPLRTSLDVDVQSAAEQVLAGTDTASGLVAIRPSTGEVLAAASGPGGDGTSTSTAGRYAPGSTFKVVTALGMLRAGLDPDSVVACTPTITVDGREFRNVPGYPTSALGDVSLRTAFANSCNTAMISQRDLVTQQALHDAAADLGLGSTGGAGVAAFGGSVPAEAEGTEHAASMIGQGRVEASVLSMATVSASVVAGHRVVPWIVDPELAGEADDGEAEEQPAADGLTEAEAETLRSLMRSVVTDGGGDVLADLPGEVGAKTGTAQVGDGDQANAWMIAFRGDLAVAVLVTDGESGSGTAGPLVRAFLEAVPQ